MRPRERPDITSAHPSALDRGRRIVRLPHSLPAGSRGLKPTLTGAGNATIESVGNLAQDRTYERQMEAQSITMRGPGSAVVLGAIIPARGAVL